MIKVALFDVDGVIYDSSNLLEKSYSAAITSFSNDNRELNLQRPSEKEILAQVGKTYKEIISALFPTLPKQYHSLFRSHVLTELDKCIRNKEGSLMPHVREVLEDLHTTGISIGAASNGSQQYIDAVLDTYDLRRFFTTLYYVDFIRFFDKSDIIERYLEKTGALPTETLFIGDRKVDYDAAVKTGVRFVGIRGHGSDDELTLARVKIESLNELPGVIQTF